MMGRSVSSTVPGTTSSEKPQMVLRFAAQGAAQERVTRRVRAGPGCHWVRTVYRRRQT